MKLHDESTYVTPECMNNALQTLWAEGDKVNVFHPVSATEVYVNDEAFKFDSGSSFTGLCLKI